MISPLFRWIMNIFAKDENQDKIMLNLVIFGPPGSGKGTQAKKLLDKYNLIHISTGDLFRYEMGNNTPLGEKAKSYMAKGELVPDEVTIGMLENKVNMHPEANGFIFDGFPRNIIQSEALDKFLTSKGTQVSGCVALDVDDEEIIKRILERGKTSGRTDDNDESIIRNRIDVYNQETAPVLEYYRAQNKAHLVHGIGSIDEIFNRLCETIDGHLVA